MNCLIDFDVFQNGVFKTNYFVPWCIHQCQMGTNTKIFRLLKNVFSYLPEVLIYEISTYYIQFVNVKISTEELTLKQNANWTIAQISFQNWIEMRLNETWFQISSLKDLPQPINRNCLTYGFLVNQIEKTEFSSAKYIFAEFSEEPAIYKKLFYKKKGMSVSWYLTKKSKYWAQNVICFVFSPPPDPIAQPACTMPTALPRSRGRITSRIAAAVRGPFTAEAETHQTARDQKLAVVLRERAEQREKGEPDDGDLQRLHPANASDRRIPRGILR